MVWVRKSYLALFVAFMGINLMNMSAMATETKFDGELRVRGELFDETGQDKDNNGAGINDRTASLWDTRMRLQVDFMASDNLKGVYQLEIGDITWGGTDDAAENRRDDRDGGSLGTDAVNLETRQLYIDADVPAVPLNVKLGLMQLTLGHGFVFDETAAALLISADIDPVKTGLFTLKAAEGGLKDSGDVDYYGLFVNTMLRDIGSAGVFGVYGLTRGSGLEEVGYDSFDATVYDKYDAYWLGMTADIAIDPFVVAFEADHYGADYDRDSGKDLDAAGWLAYLDVGANLQPVKLGIAGLYATGNNNNVIGDEDSKAFRPILPTDPEDACVVNWDNLYLLDITGNVVSNLVSGKLYAEAVPTEVLKVGVSTQGYWLEKQAKATGAGNGDFIGTEVDLDVAYNVYDQLTYEIEAAYMFTDNDVWGVEAGGFNSVDDGIAAEDINAEDLWFLSHKLIYHF